MASIGCRRHLRIAPVFAGQGRGAKRGQKNDRALHPVEGSVLLFPEGLPAPFFDSGHMIGLAATARQTEPDSRDVVSLICFWEEKNGLSSLYRVRREATEILRKKCPTRRSARGGDARECGAVREACRADRDRVGAGRSRFESCMPSWSVALVQMLQSDVRTIPGSGVMRRAQCHSVTHLAQSILRTSHALRCSDCRVARGDPCGGRPVGERLPEDRLRLAYPGLGRPVRDGIAT